MAWELSFLDWLQGFHTPVLDAGMKLASTLGNAGAVWILLALFLLLFSKTRRIGLILAAALCVDVVLCNGILKNLVARTRPFEIKEGVGLLIARPMDFSFPSGHTAAAFASVTALKLSGAKRFWIPALVLACVMAGSRLYFYVHYPTDILGGVVVGGLSGYLGFFVIQGRKSGKWIRKRGIGAEEGKK